MWWRGKVHRSFIRRQELSLWEHIRLQHPEIGGRFQNRPSHGLSHILRIALATHSTRSCRWLAVRLLILRLSARSSPTRKTTNGRCPLIVCTYVSPVLRSALSITT